MSIKIAEGVYKLYAPLYVPKNKKGDKAFINLNNYRNWHYQASNTYKKKYKDLMQDQINELPTLNSIALEIHIYARDKRLFDIGNIGSIQEKFFLDAVVESNKLVDDDYTYVPETHTYFKEIDKDNPRIEFIIKELKPMKILMQLDTSDIAKALVEYVNKYSQGSIEEEDVIDNLPENFNVSVEIDTDSFVSDDDDTEKKPTKKRKRRTKAEIEADKQRAAEEAKREEEENDPPPFDLATDEPVEAEKKEEVSSDPKAEESSTESKETASSLFADPVEDESDKPVAETTKLFG
jgi:hypothetical protein